MPTQAEYDALKSEVAELKRQFADMKYALGDWNQPQLSRAEMTRQRAAGEVPQLPNGDNPVFWGMRWGRFAIDDAVTTVGGFAQRIAALEARPAGTVQTPPPAPAPVPSGNVLPLVPANGRKAGAPDMRNTNSVLLDDAKIASMESQGPQVFANPVQFNGPVGIGGAPLDGHPLTMRKSGEVVFLSKVAKANTQDKTADVWRAASVSGVNEYDNGSRLIRGGFWHNGVLHRVQNVIDIFGFDSAGTVSKSHEDYSKPQVERCQDWIVREDEAAREIVLVACRAGWGARIAASTDTTNMNNGNNFDRSASIVEPLLP